MISTILFAICAIVLAARLPIFLTRQGVPKKDKIIIMLFLFTLLIAAFFAVGAFGELLALLRALI